MNKTYPTLYARSSTGAVLTWFMTQKGDRYTTTSGQIDGKKVETEETKALGKNIGKKNETSPEKQATLEIEARYKKQLKSGYFKSINDIDIETFTTPMLAKDFEDYEHKINWDEGIGVQIKYNGGRIVAKRTGFFTRTGERYRSIPHIEEEIAPKFEQYPNAVIDGEAYNYELREQLNDLMSILRKTVDITKEELELSRKVARFYIYDAYDLGFSKDECYTVRKEKIDSVFHNQYNDKNSFIREVPTWYVHSKKQLDELYETFLKDRQEGAIIRILKQPYQNKRTKFLLKYKPEDDAEGIILKIEEGGNGRHVITFSWNNKVFDGTFKGNRKQADKFLKEKDLWIGKEVTFLYTGLTGKGIPNYARLDINNCLKK